MPTHLEGEAQGVHLVWRHLQKLGQRKVHLGARGIGITVPGEPRIRRSAACAPLGEARRRGCTSARPADCPRCRTRARAQLWVQLLQILQPQVAGPPIRFV